MPLSVKLLSKCSTYGLFIELKTQSYFILTGYKTCLNFSSKIYGITHTLYSPAFP
jgi:hypothetical protein